MQHYLKPTNKHKKYDEHDVKFVGVIVPEAAGTSITPRTPLTAITDLQFLVWLFRSVCGRAGCVAHSHHDVMAKVPTMI